MTTNMVWRHEKRQVALVLNRVPVMHDFLITDGGIEIEYWPIKDAWLIVYREHELETSWSASPRPYPDIEIGDLLPLGPTCRLFCETHQFRFASPEVRARVCHNLAFGLVATAKFGLPPPVVTSVRATGTQTLFYSFPTVGVTDVAG